MAAEPTILIVDDEPFNVDYLEQELEDFGYRTISASDGQEALEKVAAEPPDLILLDVMMPKMDGFTVCRILKEDPATAAIPVIIMTALGDTDDRIKGIEAGADDFLSKPVNDRELQARLKSKLRIRESFEQRIDELRRAKDHFEKFVPDAVKRIVAENPDAPDLEKHEKDVTVLFLDITGYGQLSEALAGEALNALVERYFSRFLDAVVAGGGDINETAGDGFMAIFDGEEHAERAVETALGLIAEADRLNANDGGTDLNVHMGLASGAALVGSTRFDGARGSRWTFTASGPVTNLAARLADRAQSGEILVSGDMEANLPNTLNRESLGPTALKNIAEPVEVFRISAA